MKYIKDVLRKIIISVPLCMMGELEMVNMDNPAKRFQEMRKLSYIWVRNTSSDDINNREMSKVSQGEIK